METRTSRESSTTSRRSPALGDLIDAVRKIAAYNARAPLETEEQMLLFLSSWWSRTYNRPLKDPLLQEYSFEELLYEFYDRSERELAAKELIEKENDKIEEDKEKAALDWAEIEEKKELEALKKAEADKLAEAQANQKWMEEQLAKQKELLGEDFGEDFNENFD